MSLTKIMLVEDDPDDRDLFMAALSQIDSHIQIFYACDGVDALEKLSGEVCKGVQLILLDINMPRMDGWEVLEQLKRDIHFREIPVIILSTSTRQDQVERALKRGQWRLFQNQLNLIRSFIWSV